MINSTARAKSHLHQCVSKKNKREVHPENPFISDPCKNHKKISGHDSHCQCRPAQLYFKGCYIDSLTSPPALDVIILLSDSHHL